MKFKEKCYYVFQTLHRFQNICIPTRAFKRKLKKDPHEIVEKTGYCVVMHGSDAWVL